MKLENQMKTGLGDRYKCGDEEYIVASAGINKVVVAAGAAPNPYHFPYKSMLYKN